jgi:hypothetical protein
MQRRKDKHTWSKRSRWSSSMETNEGSRVPKCSGDGRRECGGDGDLHREQCLVA